MSSQGSSQLWQQAYQELQAQQQQRYVQLQLTLACMQCCPTASSAARAAN